MKKLGKILLLLISLSPISAWILLMTVCGSYIAITFEEPLSFFILAAFVSIPVQWIFFIANVFRNTKIAKDKKTLWVALLIFFHFVIFPFYWYFYIWRDDKEPKKEQTPTPPITPISVIPRFRSKSIRALILAISILPIIFFLTAVISLYTGLPHSIFYAFGILLYALLPGLIIFYVIDVFHNQNVARDKRAIWTLLLIAGNFVVFPFYWYTYIWKKS